MPEGSSNGLILYIMQHLWGLLVLFPSTNESSGRLSLPPAEHGFSVFDELCMSTAAYGGLSHDEVVLFSHIEYIGNIAGCGRNVSM